MAILYQFVFRLAFGLALGMAITSSQKVSSGFFRNHLYVTLGLATLGLLVAQTLGLPRLAPLLSMAGSYVGAIGWLYQRHQIGKAALWIVTGAALWAILAGQNATADVHAAEGQISLANITAISSGMVLGVTLASMLLGHWYLNSPGMQLAPLRKLLIVSGGALVFHAIASGLPLLPWQLPLIAMDLTPPAGNWQWMAILRWLLGIGGALGLIWMAWQTLAIPNTQSATGILYVAVIAVFTGELIALLLSAQQHVTL